MNNYKDKYSRYHDKPVTNGEYSSNNGWIYTAYSRYLVKGSVDLELNIQCYNACVKSYSPLRIDRSPNDPTPPLSKDEVIGMVSLGLITAKELQANHWNFCNLEEFTPKKLTFKAAYKAATLLYKIRGEHRNYMWQQGILEAYPLAFYLAPFDQYYVLKYYDMKPSILQTIAFYLNFISTFYKGNNSVRMLLWLQCEDLNHWLVKYIPRDKWVKAYFDSEHPFVKGLK